MLRAQADAVQRAYAAAHAEGYRAGFRDGIAEAQKILAKVLPPNPTAGKST